ncbi:ABC transporter permease [bacterium]|nr:ABC transporter permease [bacterium]
MNLIKLNLSYIRQRRLNTILNVLLLGMGIATIVILLLFREQLRNSLNRNAQGIDLVIGAKGSPLQLILNGIYHVDVPTGNIPLEDAKLIMQRQEIKKAIPLALGDSYEGYRIVGTDHGYPEHYGAKVAEGRLWQHPLEVTVGAEVAKARNLHIGDEIVSSHGIVDMAGAHAEHPIQVVGILKASGTVIDRLVLTSIETVWEVHDEHAEQDEHAEEDDHHDEGGNDHDEHEDHEDAHPEKESGSESEREITTLLIQYRSPVAAVMFPRFVNTQTNLQAASPAFEVARLLSLLGVGLDAMQVFGIILIVAATLGVFIALYNALQERKYDLAIMRTLGASRTKLLWHVLLEGLMLTTMGTMAGLFLGHVTMFLLGIFFQQAEQIGLTGASWLVSETWLLVLASVVGIIAALVPAVQAYRVDIAETLAKN